jgi:hypothetical protein
MGTNVTARERLDMYAYLLGAKTEFWRAHRQYAGIIHFVYLTCSYPGVYTADHFADVTKLKLDPAFADYLGEAFKPLGVYLNFFQPSLAAGTTRDVKVMLVNDLDQSAEGTLTLVLENAKGRVLEKVERSFSIGAQGDASMEVPITVPATASGRCTLKAIANARDKAFGGATQSRRWLTVSPAQP